MHFENWAYNLGVLVHKYTTDNGIFGAHEFTSEISAKGQIVKYCGVGAHHQNGNAERSIRTVSNMARVMMLHASLRWPETADAWLLTMLSMYTTICQTQNLVNPPLIFSQVPLCLVMELKIFMSGVVLVMYWTPLYRMVINSLVGNLNLVLRSLWESLLLIVAMSP